MADTNLNSKPDFQMLSFGQFGSEYIVAGETGTTDIVYKAITCLDTAVVTLTQIKGDTTLTSIPLAIGVTVYGLFTSVSVASGKVLAYIG